MGRAGGATESIFFTVPSQKDVSVLSQAHLDSKAPMSVASKCTAKPVFALHPQLVSALHLPDSGARRRHLSSFVDPTRK